jgi:N-acetylneuraminate synthase
MGVVAYKVGSGECNNYPLLRLIAATGKPTIVSTGMNGMAAVRQVVDIFQEKKSPLALLHTTNLYPTSDEQVRLGAMDELMHNFPDLSVGLSDHTVDNLSCIAAMARGATIVERHFTDTKDRIGPDIVCSMDVTQCKELVSAAQRIPQLLGGNKEALEAEAVTTRFAFASVVAERIIRKGELLNSDNIWVRRPGTGEFLAADYESLLGRVVAVDIEKGEQVKTSDLV